MNWGAYLLHTCKVGAKSGQARRSHVVCLAGCLACNLVEIINGDCLAVRRHSWEFTDGCAVQQLWSPEQLIVHM